MAKNGFQVDSQMQFLLHQGPQDVPVKLPGAVSSVTRTAEHVSGAAWQEPRDVFVVTFLGPDSAAESLKNAPIMLQTLLLLLHA